MKFRKIEKTIWKDLRKDKKKQNLFLLKFSLKQEEFFGDSVSKELTYIEEWQSGLLHWSRKPAWVEIHPPWVRIPPPLPHDAKT